jgi:HD-GYP domain-containing protein (c-di-GMP phosphodiesterase class II)
MGGDEFCVLAATGAAGAGDVVRRAAAALRESNETFTVTCAHGVAVVPTEAPSCADALRLADQRMYEHKVQTTSIRRQTSDVLLRVLSERNPSLREHGSSVAELARAVAARLGLPQEEQARVGLAAELHDVGKTAIPDSILNKNGPLTDDEWEYMRRHTLIGERIILAAPSLAHVVPLVRSSHERVDGTGYPDGLAGDEIPIGSRIIFVCDAFDAMTSDRVYRARLTLHDALDELRRAAGTQFDAHVVEAFLDIVASRGSEHPAAAAA